MVSTFGSVKNEKQCPTCGCDDFDTVRAMKLHHSSAHDESIAGVEVKCDECNKVFRKSKNQKERYELHFCSNDCQSKFWDKSKVVNCYHCDKEIKKQPSQIKNCNKDFCSKECVSEHKKNKVELNCFECGESIKRIKSKYKRHETHFCDTKCRDRYYTGDDSPFATPGDTNDYGLRWKNIRDTVRKLDSNTCQKCGIKDNKLHVHHIIPRREFDDVNDSNYKENLVTLCPSCHKTLEKMNTKEQLNELEVERLDP